MNVVEIDDPIELLKFGKEFYEKFKSTGLVSEFGSDLKSVFRAISEESTRNTVGAYKSFIEAGMSREEAFELVRLRVIDNLVDRMELKKVIAASLGKAAQSCKISTQ